MNTSSWHLASAALISLNIGMLTASAPSAMAQGVSHVTPVANPAAAVPATPTPTEAAVNVENPPPTAKPDPNAPTETEILATDGADFASKERIAVFRGDVRVNDPRFQLACDKLTVFLSKGAGAEGAGKDDTAGNTPPPADGTKDPNRSGGIDHARADGHVIIIQKRSAAKAGEEPKISIGRAEWAEFDNKTGDMVLHGWPSVEQNGNTHVATSPSTVMTLHKDNSMLTVGPSRTVIKQQQKEDTSNQAGGSPKSGGKARPRGTPQG